MDMKVIGHVRTCYGEKFGVPRQPGIVPHAWGELVFDTEFRNADTLRGLDGFSHVWLIFVFHQSIQSSWKPTVRPPRLGGNEKVGVFASRSPFRPNPLGLSVVKLESIDLDHPEGPLVRLSGVDLVDGTPVLDIKPYISYADAISDTRSGYVNGMSESLDVKWLDGSLQSVSTELKELITATLATDPRPAYQSEQRKYGCLISGYNVRWEVLENCVLVHSCTEV